MSDVVHTISRPKEKRIPVFVDNRIRRAVLFGSYGKGRVTEESDIDLLVDSGLKGLKSQLDELADKIDSDYRAMHKEIPWTQIYGLRNRIVHDYEGVNFMFVWEIICNDLPEPQEMLMNVK